MVLCPVEQQLILPNRACTSNKYQFRKFQWLENLFNKEEEEHLIDLIAPRNRVEVLIKFSKLMLFIIS